MELIKCGHDKNRDIPAVLGECADAREIYLLIRLTNAAICYRKVKENQGLEKLLKGINCRKTF